MAAIVNPVAGRGKAEARWREVEEGLARHGVEARSFCTSYPRHAIELTRYALDLGFTTIVAVGGDGTIHEVVNGFLQENRIRDDVRLGIVGAGTGMDFTRNVNVPRSVEATTTRLLANREELLDVGLCHAAEHRAFINFAEVGIGSRVAAHAAQLPSDLPGHMAFFLGAVRAIATHKNLAVKINVGGRHFYEGPAASVVVANGRFLGGGMKIAPTASMVDGLLDVLVLGDFGRGELLSQLWRVYPGTHVGHPKVAFLRGRDVEVVALPPPQLDLDGELYSGESHGFTVLKGALRLLA